MQWHIFCEVIDNFGDIGVCWRLAKQLHAKQQDVTLWVDDLVSFQAICPEVNPALTAQCVQGVQVYHWQTTLPTQGMQQLTKAQVVVEAFGCKLPEAVLTLMRAQAQPPLWINLEYLTAETWAEDVHGLPSPQQGMEKAFFFPGFSEKTGGLLWEPELLTLADKIQNIAARQILFTQLGIAPELAEISLHISLFSYENSQVNGLLQALSEYSQTVHLLVPQGRILPEIEQWFAQSLKPCQSYQKNQLTLSVLPFMAQPTYDQLLATCQLNFVRGEESFVRAQMLGLPFVWHIYQQEENAHLVKLEAFLARYLTAFPQPLAENIATAFRGWNQPEQSLSWPAILDALESWQIQAKHWQQRQVALGSLTENLVQFAQTRYSASHF